MDFKEKNYITVYPNPFSEVVQFELSDKLYHQPISIFMYDVMGRVVGRLFNERQSIIRWQSKIDTGIYFWKAIDQSTGQLIGQGKLSKVE